MICKKCHTATPDDEETCMNCGKPHQKQTIKNSLITLGLLAAIVALISVFFLVDKQLQAEEKLKEQLAAEQEKDADMVAIESEVLVKEPIYTDPLETEWITLASWYEALEDYLEKSDNPNILTKNGFLFDYNTEKFLQPEDLEDETPIENGGKQIYLLNIDLKLLWAYEEFGHKKSGPMTMVAREVTAGIALYGPGVKGLLYRENYQKLLEEMKILLTPIMRPNQDDALYQAILQSFHTSMGAVKADDDTDTYEVRYLAADENFAFLITSDQSTGNIYYTFLKKTLDSWDVVFLDMDIASRVAAFHEIYGYSRQVNEALLPETIFLQQVNEAIDKGSIESFLLSMALIEADEVLTFISAGNNVFYAEAGADKKFVGIKIDEKWQGKPVSNFLEAEIFLKVNMSEPSILHVLQK